MAIQLTKKDLEGNPQFAKQINNQLGLVDEGGKGETSSLAQLRLDYAENWAKEHLLLSILIKILLSFGGYDEQNIGSDGKTK